jgi:chromosome segregation ATPase
MFRKPKEPAMAIDIAALQNALRDAVTPALQELLTNSVSIEQIVGTLLDGISHLDIMLNFMNDNIIQHMDKRFDRIEALLKVIPEVAELEQQRIKQEEEARQKELDKYLDIKIEDLELTVRSYRCLKHAHGHLQAWGGVEGIFNLKTVRDLIKYTEAQLLRIPSFGRKSLNEVKELLASMGLSLSKG